MSWHAVDPLITTAFGVACFLAGVLVTVWWQRHRRRQFRPAPLMGRPTVIDAETDAELAAQARRWANQRGRPDLAGLAHHRLRTTIAWDQRRASW